MIEISNITERIRVNLIHHNLKNNPISFRKAIVITYLHLFLALFGLIIYLTCTLLSLNNDPALFVGVCICLSLVWIFKNYGNLVLSSNLLATLCFILLATTVPSTGGLFSDNLLWLIISPLIALLFGNKLSGFFWLCCLLMFATYLYVFNLSTNFYQIVNPNTDITYYYISYCFFFSFIFGIVIIFEMGQSFIIKMLNKQKEILEQQKSILEQQKELLELQKEEITHKNEELEEIQITLRKSNAELENFAFVASHDLKEPLRMIKMYSGFIQKRLGVNTDKSVHEFMGYINDGAERMELLLNDLLQYSRLGKKKDDIKEIDLNNTLFVVINNILATMKDADASIMANKLPVIEASHTEMIQLFQNLIANSIKFRRQGVLPEIKILSQDNGEHYLISLADNGIGIKEEHREKVFGIFEKLHKHTEYEGTGIGLATCKKIVGSVGGDIWLESTEGVGTTFFFTLPKPSLN